MPSPEAKFLAPDDLVPVPDGKGADERASYLAKLKEIFPPAVVEVADLERRVAALEERARREDQESAGKERLGEMGLVFPEFGAVFPPRPPRR
jgi:hypothetical protein